MHKGGHRLHCGEQSGSVGGALLAACVQTGSSRWPAGVPTRPWRLSRSEEERVNSRTLEGGWYLQHVVFQPRKWRLHSGTGRENGAPRPNMAKKMRHYAVARIHYRSPP